MGRVEFRMDNDLLKSVIFKQAGSILKAIEECIQNSLDANATIIKISIDMKGFDFYDNGCGMTKEQIIDCFSVFGRSEKSEDSEKIGRFGMGRGQVFAFGYNEWRTKTYKMKVDALETIRDFDLEENLKNFEGTKISCIFYEPLGEYEFNRTVSGIKDYYLPKDGVEFYINEKLYDREIADVKVYEELCSEDFEVFEAGYYSGRIFSNNLYVRHFNTLTMLNINCKKKMELNFARNQFLDNHESTKKLEELISEIERRYLKTVKRFDATKGIKVLEYCREGKLKLDDYFDKKIIEMADGEMVSINSLKDKNIIFGRKNSTSDRAIQFGFTVVNDSQESFLVDLVERKILSMKLDTKRPSDVVETGYHKDADAKEMVKEYGKSSLVYYYFARYLNKNVFDNKRSIVLGDSDVAEAWTDGETYIALNKKLFIGHSYKQTGLMKIYNVLCHEYAHDEDDTNETAHDVNFYKRFYKISEITAYKFGVYMRATLSEIKKLYSIELEKCIA